MRTTIPSRNRSIEKSEHGEAKLLTQGFGHSRRERWLLSPRILQPSGGFLVDSAEGWLWSLGDWEWINPWENSWSQEDGDLNR
ncbi:hypothetical protein P8452_21428 [Trifolium repens]|nr:hypothetical protein P8452_21428 [Trifolium repens]